jgi:putative ATPase
MDLFSQKPVHELPGTPLAERLRPREWSEFLGQTEILKKIQAFIKQNYLPNLILWGPPGCGKTTLAKLLARHFDAEFIELHAVEAGAKLLKEEGDNARNRRRIESRRTVIFIDEIHRLNKAQQDVLLPFIEQGDFTLVGATTENPSYELNRALMSRSRLLVFTQLSESDLSGLLERALANEQLQLQDVFTPETPPLMLEWADGDARRLLTALEEVLSNYQNQDAKAPLSWEAVEKIVGSRPLAYDKNSDQHYDVISAFIKSLRGSDADAALYWLARMVKGGENPTFIARRLVILASEDVGNADPRALQVALAAAQAVEMIGWPEGGINLAQAVTYLAMAPKSNRSYMAYKKALDFTEKTGSLPVPLHLRSSKTELMKSIGYGKDYDYPHDHAKGWVDQSYLPDGINPPPFYEPSKMGFEKTMLEYEAWRKSQKSEKS